MGNNLQEFRYQSQKNVQLESRNFKLMDVSIIIVNYNTKDLLINCINSIYTNTTGILFEIIVVDNNSNDGSEFVIKNKFPDVIFIQSGSNLGFGLANNIGIEKSKGEFVFLLNSDTIIINNAIKILYKSFENLSIGACGGNLFDSNNSPTVSFFRIMPGFLNEIDMCIGGLYSKILFRKNIFFNHSKNLIELKGYISGADLMIRKSVLNKIGLFSPRFFLYFEEVELQYRIRKSGFKILSEPEAKIIHIQGASEIQNEKKLQRFIKSKYIYYDLTNQIYLIPLYFTIYTISSLIKIILYSFLKFSKLKEIVFMYKLNLIGLIYFYKTTKS